MKRTIIIKCKINLPADQMNALEKKIRKDAESGLILIPYYCEAIVAEDIQTEGADK